MTTLGGSRPTFGQWLDDQATSGVGDVRALAVVWRQAKGGRPKISATKSVVAWLESYPAAAQAVPDLGLAISAAVQAYRGQPAADSNTRSTPAADPDQPGVGPGASPAAAAAWQAGQVAADEEVQPHEGLAALLGSIMGEIRGKLDVLRLQLQGLDQRLEAIITWQGEQDERLAPVQRLLAELGEAMDTADQLEDDRPNPDGPEPPGWTGPSQDGPEQPWQHGQGGLWGTQPGPVDWAALHEAGDPEAADPGGPPPGSA